MESIGGTCPNCKYTKVLHQFGDPDYLHFDACPKCGFGKAVYPNCENSEWKPQTLTGNKLWSVIKFIFGHDRQYLYNDSMRYVPDETDINELLFSYSEQEVLAHKQESMEVFTQKGGK